MKLVLPILMLLIISCNTAEKKINPNMPGAYKMKYQRLKNDKTDTTYKSLDQLKIFTENYIMYANINSPDSVSSFGIGTYTYEKDTVLEHIIYSASDTTKNESLRTFSLHIKKTPAGYIQIIPNILSAGKNYELTEEYDAVGKEIKSPIDGAWRQVNRYTIIGNDTTTSRVVQFKIYYMGHCIWANTGTDSLNISHTGIGLGTFEMSGTNKLKESMSASTYSTVRGHDFDIDIAMNGTDSFTQTITNPDGSKNIEVYMRLK
jgi:hypothetical protein